MPVLRLGHLGPVSYALDDPDGRAEQAVDPRQPAQSAFRLAQGLTRLPPGTTLDTLPVALLHRLFHAIYCELYSGPVENQARCEACEERFEFALDLEDIMATQDAGAAGVPLPQDGWWTLSRGGRIRAPCHGDLAAQTRGALLAGITEGDVDPDEADAFLDRAAPLLDFDVDTACPRCGTAQMLRFNMAQYLVRKIHGERPFLLREVHLIASQYNWSHAEILALTRTDRRAYAGLIQSERLQSQRRRLQAVS
jgi:hypothetical protein